MLTLGSAVALQFKPEALPEVTGLFQPNRAKVYPYFAAETV